MKHSINSLVHNHEAELILLWELYRCGGEGETGYIVDRAIARFPVLQTPKEQNRVTLSGRPWWPGRFRFDLSRLGGKGEAQWVKRGLWRITQKGIERLPDNIQKEGKVMPERTVTEKLMELWTNLIEGSKAERCQQVCERVLGLDLLSELPEMKDTSDKLRAIIDFNELHRMVGYLYVTDFGRSTQVRIGKTDTLTEKLMTLWALRTDGSKTDMCQQVCERIFSLLSLAALPETKPIFNQLWELIDFDELFRMTGSLGVTGFWGKDTYLEPF